ncbi:unnamed protein product [Penicillium nalgiovense]|nr:unnamed protein product [Penicillium nalgiovense]
MVEILDSQPSSLLHPHTPTWNPRPTPTTRMKTLTPLLMLAASAIVTPHNNLYVYAYHTGAGLNDAVLTKDVNTASSIYLNGTNAFIDFNTKLLWGVVATGDNKFTSWNPTLINAGQGSNGFSVKGNSFMWSEASGFGGWLVCNWYHNAPQLFYLNRYYDATIPFSCSKIQLKAEYIN